MCYHHLRFHAFIVSYLRPPNSVNVSDFCCFAPKMTSFINLNNLKANMNFFLDCLKEYETIKTTSASKGKDI
jgi:hypothetical protein